MNRLVLEKVLEWSEHHRGDPLENDSPRRKTADIDEWDQKFFQVDQEMVFEIILVRPSLVTLPALRCA